MKRFMIACDEDQLRALLSSVAARAAATRVKQNSTEEEDTEVWQPIWHWCLNAAIEMKTALDMAAAGAPSIIEVMLPQVNQKKE